MDELKNTPENSMDKAPEQPRVSLDELLKWADQAIDSLENSKKAQARPTPPHEQVQPAGNKPEDIHMPEPQPAHHENSQPTAEAEDDIDDYLEDDFDDNFDDEPEDEPEDIDYNDDELLCGYIWDEETGRLYKVKEKNRRPLLLPLFITAIVLIAAAAAVLNKVPLMPAAKVQDSSILAEEHQPQQSETVLPAQQQQAADAQAVQYIPAEILSDGDVVAVMASTEAAHALLEDVKAYFHSSVTEEGEKESVFEDPVEVRPLPNGTDRQISSYDELFARFTSSSSPIKVRTTLTTVETEIIPFETETEDHPTLIEGTRIVASMGREGSETKRTRTVYINGDRSSSRSGSDTEAIKPMDMLIYEGEEKLDPEEDSPGRHEGEKGPRQGDLTFIDPIDGDISCNFGQLYGVLHLGLDYEPEDDKVLASEAGTVVTLMERGGYGLMLEIDHGSGFVTRYAHLDSASVAIGDKVQQGQAIATAGSSGNVDEKTLHFEIRVDGLAYNPRYYLD